jgi:hypothetical protein
VRLILGALLLVVPAAGQAPEIGVIEIYGLRQVPAAKVRQALGVAEGDPLPRSKADAEEAIEKVPGVVRARLEAACCEAGRAVLYVGIEERGATRFEFRDPPKEPLVLPEEIHDAYVRFLTALGEAVRAGDTQEDLTQGHSLMKNAACRAQQERFVEFAAAQLDRIRDVLRNSFDEEHRAIAAYVIGYAPDKKAVVEDLLYAVRDPDETVRNNAMRALAAIEVYAKLNPQLGIRIPPTWLIEMLNSLVWTDRTTAAVNLVNLTEERDPEVLNQIRERALASLIEMAQWKHLAHALPAFILLGRVAGMKEEEIQKAWEAGNREAVVARGRELTKKRLKGR